MILGIDPGLNGALAFYEPMFDELEIVDMPTVEYKIGKRNHRQIDAHKLAHIIAKRDQKGELDLAYLEFVSASPQMGVTSAFNFGKGYGVVIGVLAGQGVPYTPVRPSVWKPSMNCPADKAAARLRASELMPQFAHLWPLAKHDGRAEATLIARYGSKQK